MKQELGGKRLGSEDKQMIHMDGFPRSTHNLDQAFRSTMSVGTLVPFLVEPMLPGDKARINLNAHILTLPTNGPLFGSLKLQLDLFKVPWRLYNSWVHNNIFDIGRDVSQLKIPKIRLTAQPMDLSTIDDIDNAQINPSCLLAYTGIRGIGVNTEATTKDRDFNATAILSYWDIVKNYYANYQEGIGAVIHCQESTPGNKTVSAVNAESPDFSTQISIPQAPDTASAGTVTLGWTIYYSYPTSGPAPNPDEVYIRMKKNGLLSFPQLTGGSYYDDGFGSVIGTYQWDAWGDDTPLSWQYATNAQPMSIAPNVVTFPLENIDDMRMAILAFQSKTAPYIINSLDKPPYKYLYEAPNDMPNALCSQEGLAVKTYLSDRFNNWLDSEFNDYVNSISEIDTSGGSFNMEQLLLSEKIYEHYSRIMVSGGSFDDWQEVTYDVRQKGRAEIPMYVGGASGALDFQQVISSATNANEPLGTLAGRGALQDMRGGKAVIEFDEMCWLIGMASFTPRLDYSQGNAWHTMLDSWDDLHKPIFDGIGFQELPTQEMAWWDTKYDQATTSWPMKSAGVQPAWTQYMTAVNKTYGEFARQDSQMFMTLNRRYEWDGVDGIADLTTYIDPAK
mgnify:CR=1 FL=1